MQRAFDGFGVRCRGFLGLWRFFRDQYFFGRIHHRANRLGFSQSGTPAGVEVFGFGRILFGLGFGVSYALGSSCGHGLCSRSRILILGGKHRRLQLRFAIFVFLGLAQAAFFCQLFFLASNEFGLAASLFLASGEFGLIENGDYGFGRFYGLGFSRIVFIAFDKGAFFTHFHLNGAGFTRGVGLLDLAGRLFHQGDFFALRRVCSVTGF